MSSDEQRDRQLEGALEPERHEEADHDAQPTRRAGRPAPSRRDRRSGRWRANAAEPEQRHRGEPDGDADQPGPEQAGVRVQPRVAGRDDERDDQPRDGGGGECRRDSPSRSRQLHRAELVARQRVSSGAGRLRARRVRPAGSLRGDVAVTSRLRRAPPRAPRGGRAPGPARPGRRGRLVGERRRARRRVQVGRPPAGLPSRPTTSAAQSSPTWRIARQGAAPRPSVGDPEDRRVRLDRADALRDDDRREPAAPSRRSRRIGRSSRPAASSTGSPRRYRSAEPLQERADGRRRRDDLDERPAVDVHGPGDLVGARQRRGGLVVPPLVARRRRIPAHPRQHADQPLVEIDLAELAAPPRANWRSRSSAQTARNASSGRTGRSARRPAGRRARPPSRSAACGDGDERVAEVERDRFRAVPNAR